MKRIVKGLLCSIMSLSMIGQAVQPALIYAEEDEIIEENQKTEEQEEMIIGVEDEFDDDLDVLDNKEPIVENEEEEETINVENATKSGVCGDNLTWTLDDNGTLTISGTGDMSDYFEAPWYNYQSDIKTILIKSGVTSIGDFGFYGCSGLTSLTISASVNSIGEDAFSGCSSLTSIVVNEDNPVYDSRNNCNAIIETATNTLVIGCKNTTIPTSVTCIGDHAFCECNSLTSITIPNSVTRIGNHAFYECSSLSSIRIPDSVVSLGVYSFCNCFNLKSISLSKSITSIPEGIFENCDSLDNVIIPDGVTSLGNVVFFNCTSLKNVTIPNSVKLIEGAAFCVCLNLQHIYYSGSENEWNAIDILDDNDSLLDAALIYAPTTFTLSATSYTYDGKAHRPTVTVKDSNGKVIAATNYTVSYTKSDGTAITSPINVGTYKVKVVFKGNYSGTKDISYTIKAKTGSTVELSFTTKAYTGSTLKPTVTVKDSTGTVLTSGTDYTISYRDENGKAVTPKAVGTYTIKVTMKGNYSGSVSKAYKIIPKTTTIGTPTIASDGITVKWTKNTTGSGYYIYRSVNGASYTKVKTITSNATISWKDTGSKTNGAKYQYKIIAYKTVNGTTYKSAYSAVKTIYFVSRPAISSLTNGSAGKMTIKWGSNTKGTGYQIQYATTSDFSDAKNATVTSNSTVSKTIGSLTKGKTYYIKVRTYKTVGSTKYYSAWSATKNIKITK